MCVYRAYRYRGLFYCGMWQKPSSPAMAWPRAATKSNQGCDTEWQARTAAAKTGKETAEKTLAGSAANRLALAAQGRRHPPLQCQGRG